VTPPGLDDFFGGFNFYRTCERGTRLEEVGGGSGFIVSADGLIVTNKHVVLDENAEYTVILDDGRKFDAEVLARDEANDLAVVKINASDLPVAKIGESSSVRLGQTVIAIGNALGEFSNSVSIGVVSGLSRELTAEGAGGFSERIEGVIQTDAAINEGNSGGPLLNLKGEVIGINTAIASGAENIGFAIPIDAVKRSIESVKRTGKIETPYLGVRYAMLNEASAKTAKVAYTYGARVQATGDGPAVIKGSPAEKAGIKSDDVILEVNGERLERGKTLGLALQKYAVGDEISLKVVRGGEEREVRLKLEERPKNL
jgi:serine protease Do